MLSEAVIELAKTEWEAPIVLESKKDGFLWFCVHYRNLNAVNKREVHHISLMDECNNSLGEAAVFWTQEMERLRADQ